MIGWLIELSSHYSYKRAIGDGRRNLEPQSSDEPTPELAPSAFFFKGDIVRGFGTLEHIYRALPLHGVLFVGLFGCTDRL